MFALHLRLDDSKIVDSQEVQPGIVLDFSADKQVVGIEVLRLKERVRSADLKQLEFEIARPGTAGPSVGCGRRFLGRPARDRAGSREVRKSPRV